MNVSRPTSSTHTRLEGLVDIGVDEISWRKYLTLVSGHATSTVVWEAPGKNAATLDTTGQRAGSMTRLSPG